MKRATIAAWECDGYVVCVDGRPTGPEIHEREAGVVARWLNDCGLHEIEERAQLEERVRMRREVA